MKLLTLILTTSLHLSLASEHCTIIYDKHDRADIYSRNIYANNRWRWPNKTVPYKINSGFSQPEVNNITKAIEMLNNKTCTKWIPYKTQAAYTLIQTSSSGCTASLGYLKRKTRIVKLQPGTYCMGVGSIVHELLHILGYFHEHKRPDRDQYVKIHWDRILVRSMVRDWFRNKGPNEKNTKICKSSSTTFDDCATEIVTDTFGLPYDYGSVMHYALTSGGHKSNPVMEALKQIPDGVTVGQRKGPSDLDIQKINMAYKCYGKEEEKCIKQSLNCTSFNSRKCCAYSEVLVRCKNFCDQCSDSITDCNTLVPKDGSSCLQIEFRINCPETCGVCQAKCRDRDLTCFNLNTTQCENTNSKNLCPRKCGQCTVCEDLIKSSFCKSAPCDLYDTADICRKTCGKCT